jgi:tetratricopeptide (TPR) repeat protein
MRLTILALPFLALLFHAPGARAQTAKDKFDLGIAALEKHRYAQACSLLKQSINMDYQAGGVYALARCHEGWGRTATALRYYENYLRLYPDLPDEQRARHAVSVEKARAAVKTLKPANLILRLDPSSKAIENVSLDGGDLIAPFLNQPLPINPGKHVLIARFDEGLETSIAFEVKLGDPGDVEQVLQSPVITPLTLEGSSDNETTNHVGLNTVNTTYNVYSSDPRVWPGQPPAPSADAGWTQKTWGWAALGVGGAGLAFGTVMGVLAITRDTSSADSIDAADTYATLSDVGLVVALASSATGMILLLSAPDEKREARAGVALQPLLTAGPSGGFAGIGGRW